MPVYGKGRIGKKIPAIGKRKIKRVFAEGRKIRKRKLVFDLDWPVTDTPLNIIQKIFKTNFIREIKKLGKKIQSKVVVVDWGCGRGKAITKIAEKCRKQANCYGFSEDAYPEWERRKSVKFIHAEAQDFLRYFKNNSINIMFSCNGLSYWFDKKNFLSQLLEIKNKFAIGGKLFVFPFYEEDISLCAESLEKIGWQTRKIGADAFLFTRAK